MRSSHITHSSMAIFKKKTKDEKAQLEAVQDEKSTTKAVSDKKVVKKPAAKTTKKSTKNKASIEARDKAHKVILGPVVTEKSAMLSDRNVLVLKVAEGATRISVRNAVKALYGVLPERVNIMKVRGKRVRFGRTLGKRSDWKKAMVTLPEGSHIDIFEGV